MNFRVFLLIAAIAVFGALWSSDGRYQGEQVALARLERARSSNVAVAVLDRLKTQPPVDRGGELVTFAAADAQAAARVWAVLKIREIFPLRKMRPVRSQTVDRVDPKALLARLTIAWTLGLDPGNGVTVLTDQATLAKVRLEERFCLLRFRTRQAAYFASRRAAAFLRAQISTQPKPGRFARIIIREIPIEESQAPAAGGRQTR
ncbi:MAG TPA: hypothetical protein VGP76_17100 [Planctomycetaceae bacterium]|jgi:hypothetical protein|nr:hypothetical protein [Planctomycetaceae bacterium]